MHNPFPCDERACIFCYLGCCWNCYVAGNLCMRRCPVIKAIELAGSVNYYYED